MADYRRAGDSQVIEQANQIGNRMSDLGQFIGKQKIAQQEQDRLKTQQLAQFLKEGVNPDASGLNELGQAQQGAQISSAQHTQAGFDPNSSLSKSMGGYIGQVSGQPTPTGMGASDIEKVQPVIDTAQKAQAELDKQQAIADSTRANSIRETSEAERLATKYRTPNGRAKVKVGEKGTEIEEASPNPMAITGHLNKEASDARTFVNKSLAPIREGLDAGSTSLDQIANGSQASLTSAFVTEAKILGGPRAIATIVKMMDPHGTAPGLATDLGNYFSGKGEMNITHDMANNMKTAIITRMNNLQKQLQTLRPQLSKQIELQSNLSKQMGSLPQIQDTAFQDIDALSGRAKELATKFMQEEAAAKDQNNATASNTQSAYSVYQSPMSQIGHSLANTLSSFIGGGGKQQPSQPASKVQDKAPISFEEFKARKAAGTL